MPAKINIGPCSVEGCSKPATTLRMCTAHYNAHWYKPKGFRFASRRAPGELTRQYHSEHRTWVNMLQRCLNPKHPGYRAYGQRGITVCERWRAFENFLADLGPKPSPDLTLERLNNDGNYEPSNCKWATWAEQHANQRYGLRWSKRED